MAEEGVNLGAQLRDIEEKQRLMKERVLLLGKSLVEEKEKNFAKITELKQQVSILYEEQSRMRALLERLIERTDSSARKEELMSLQRQFELFRNA